MIPAIAIADELLTETEAADRVPGRRSDVVMWLRDLGIALVGPTGVTCYRWAEVLACLPRKHAPTPKATPRRRRSATV